MASRSSDWLLKGQGLSVALLALLILVRIADPWIVESLRLKAFDSLQRWQPKVTPVAPNPVTLVEIDDTSLAALGQWPWPRHRLAELLQVIGKANSRAVGLDLLLSEADRLSPDTILADRNDLPGAIKAQLESLPGNDEALAAALAAAPSVVGLAVGFGETAPQPVPFDLPLGKDAKERLPDHERLLSPLPVFAAAAAGQGVANLSFDADGVIRRATMVHRVGQRLYPGLALELLRVGQGSSRVAAAARDDRLLGLAVGSRRIDIDAAGRSWIAFDETPRFKRLSARDLLEGNFDPAWVEDHYVLIGVTAVGLADYVSTAAGQTWPSLAFHAQILNNLLTGKSLKRPALATTLELLSIAVAGLLLVAARRQARAASTFLIFLFLLTALVGVSLVAFHGTSWLLDPSYPLFATSLLYLCVVSLAWIDEERARRRAARQAAEMERRSEARLRELQGELLRVSRRSSAGHLSSVLAHELNQPLAAVQNFVQAARRLVAKNDGPMPPQLDDILEKAVAQSKRSGDIIKGMRDVLDRGEVELDQVPAAKVIDEAVALCRGLRPLEGVDLTLSFGEGLPDVWANPVQIHQVLMNLVLNSAEAMPDAEDRRIEVSAQAGDEAMVAVRVEDSGPGLPEEVAANLFKPFLTTKIDGTGLGLSICRTIVEAHGGTLQTIPSRYGGAGFVFTLRSVEAEDRRGQSKRTG